MKVSSKKECGASKLVVKLPMINEDI